MTGIPGVTALLVPSDPSVLADILQGVETSPLTVPLLIAAFLISILLIVWTYAGYPLFISAVSRVASKRHVFNDRYEPSVTLLIVEHNEERMIRQKIENSLDQDYPREKLDVVVVDDGSTDRTLDALAEREDIEVVRQTPRRGKSSAINLGVQSSHGDLVIITDGNSLMDRNAVRNLARHFSDERVGAVGGRYEPKASSGKDIEVGNSAYWKLEKFIRTSESRIDSIVGMNGNISAVRRNIMPELHEDLITEDFDMTVCVREKGYRVLYEPEALAWKYAPNNLEDEMRQKKRRVVGTLQTLSRHRRVLFNPRYGLYGLIIMPSHKLFQMLLPLFALSLYSSMIGLEMLGDMPIFKYLTIAATGLLVAMGLSAFVLRAKPDLKFLPVVLMKYALLQYLVTVLGWKDYIKNDYTVVWEKAESTRQ